MNFTILPVQFFFDHSQMDPETVEIDLERARDLV